MINNQTISKFAHEQQATIQTREPLDYNCTPKVNHKK
jgi:hypothetical protein